MQGWPCLSVCPDDSTQEPLAGFENLVGRYATEDYPKIIQFPIIGSTDMVCKHICDTRSTLLPLALWPYKTQNCWKVILHTDKITTWWLHKKKEYLDLKKIWSCDQVWTRIVSYHRLNSPDDVVMIYVPQKRQRHWHYMIHTVGN